MANLTAARAKHATLVANTVDKITLPSEFGSVEILNRDTTSEIYARTDGVDPTVAGDDCYVVLPGQAIFLPAPTVATEARLIASNTAKYSVTGG